MLVEAKEATEMTSWWPRALRLALDLRPAVPERQAVVRSSWAVAVGEGLPLASLALVEHQAAGAA